MALTIGDNFSFRARKPLDARILVTSIANLLAIPNSTIYDGIIVYVASDKKFYTYDSNNTVDPTLQQWRELKTASYTIKTATIDNVSTSPTYNHLILTLDDDPTNPTKIDCGNAAGPKGDKGDGFAIIKLYTSVSDMTSDSNPVNDGQMVAIIDTTTNPITAKVYIRNSTQIQDTSGNENGYTFFCNLADATVIQGPQGPQGPQGVKGDTPVITITTVPATATMPEGKKITFTTGTGTTATSVSTTIYNGINLKTASFNASNELILTLTDGSTINLGQLPGVGGTSYITILGCFDNTNIPTTCNVGDIYFNTDTNMLYECKVANTWDATGSVPTNTDIYISLADKNLYAYADNTWQSYGGGNGNNITISKKDNNAVQNITGSINPTEDGLYVEDLSTIVNSISLSQKTVNSDLDYCFVGFWNTTNSNVIVTCTRGAAIPFNTKFEGNLEFNSTNKAIKLKAGHRYKLHYQCKQTETTANGNHMERFYNETTSEWLKMACNCDTNDETHTMEEIYVPTVDCEVSVRNCWCPVTSFTMRVNCTNTSPTGPGLRKIDCESAFIVTEIGKTVTVDPVAYLSKDGNLEETPVGSVILYMGNNVPKHYLACDGSEYNINDYPELAIHIKESFGSFNYFGGDGVTTFAVPNSFSWWQPTLVKGLIPRPYSVSVSSSFNTTQYQKELMFDGVISRDSCWHSAADGSDTDIWVKFDFGKSTGINGLRMAARPSYLHQLPSTFTIEGSYDDVTYTVIKSYSGLPNPASTAFREHIFDKPVNYRYYKLNHITSNAKNDGYDYCSISELEFSKVDNTQYIKYETTHKIFFGDQTTYKVSVPITYNFPQTPQIVWAEFDTANAEDDISMLGSSSITSQGDAFVAPMDGYYHATFMFPEQADIPGTKVAYHSTYVYKNGIVIGGSDRQDNSTNIRVPLNESFTLKLKKGDTINVGVLMSGQTAAFTRNGQATFCLVNTLNENKTAELMNKPNTWVVGQEYDFGDGVYGQRFTGNMPTIAAGKTVNRIIDYSISNSSNVKIIDTGGYIEMFNASNDRVITQANTVRRAADTSGSQAPLAMGWSSILIMGNNEIIMNAGSYSNDHFTTSNTYDVWVKYTK